VDYAYVGVSAKAEPFLVAEPVPPGLDRRADWAGAPTSRTRAVASKKEVADYLQNAAPYL